MYAIIENGAHQYKVQEGDTLDVQRIQNLPEDQETIDFDQVLMVGGGSLKIGQPYVDGAKVTATVVGEIKGEKLVIHKMRRRKGYHRKQGHRQRYLRVKIEKIEA